MLTALSESSSDAPSYERAVLAHFETNVGFDVGFFATIASAPTTIGVDPLALDEAFATRRYDSETLPLKHAALAARGVVVDTDVLGVEGVRRPRRSAAVTASSRISPSGAAHSAWSCSGGRARRSRLVTSSTSRMRSPRSRLVALLFTFPS